MACAADAVTGEFIGTTAFFGAPNIAFDRC
jgi:hypothetical protein